MSSVYECGSIIEAWSRLHNPLLFFPYGKNLKYIADPSFLDALSAISCSLREIQHVTTMNRPTNIRNKSRSIGSLKCRLYHHTNQLK